IICSYSCCLGNHTQPDGHVASAVKETGIDLLSARERFEDSDVYAFSNPCLIYPNVPKPELTW
ncbi:MAG TPA: hypothetical protein VLM43_14045, partial [Desulfobacterales bacterium]|nr:hypothetical protein [Desulfobacterales bacterium]